LSIIILFYFILFLVLLGFSAFFSGAETAYFSLSQAQLDEFRRSSRREEKRTAELMSSPRQLLITIVVGNTMVNITIASLAAILTARLSLAMGLNEKLVMVVDVVVVTFVILILSEILPKVVAVRRPEKFSVRVSLLLQGIYYLLFPITILLARFTRFLQSRSGFSEEKTLLTEEELKTLAEVGEEQGTLQKEEKEMIHSIFEFSETTVREIMVPRTDMIAVEASTHLSQLMELVKQKLHSRIPVYKKNIDNIIGILYVKDLLSFLHKRKRERIDLEKMVRPAYFVPEQKKIDELLREFQEEHIHMAIVVDEYGGVSGLVTLEDVIEEIVGEIQDEYDREQPLYKKIDDRTYLVDGKMPLEELNEKLHMELPQEEDVETIGGFILSLLGSLPKEKESVVYKNKRFVVEKINRNRILKVRIEILPENEQQDEQA
jgi:gliding motility-associated protein GldE